MTKVKSMQTVKVRGQRSRSQRSQPNLRGGMAPIIGFFFKLTRGFSFFDMLCIFEK